MSRVFVVADLHFGHAKVALDRGFKDPAQHDYAIVEAWNRVVTKRDVVYVLGDVFRLDRVPELNGIKKLALGNHDNRPMSVYCAHFSKVHAMFEFDSCLLTHIPVHPCQFGRYELNVHGHMHRHHIDDERFVPVSAEHCTRLEPIPLVDLIQARRDRIKNGPPECVLFAREAKKLGIVGSWEKLSVDGETNRIFTVLAASDALADVDRQLYDLADTLFPSCDYPFLISVRASS